MVGAGLGGENEGVARSFRRSVKEKLSKLFGSGGVGDLGIVGFGRFVYVNGLRVTRPQPCGILRRIPSLMSMRMSVDAWSWATQYWNVNPGLGELSL